MSAWKSSVGERPPASFGSLIKIYLRDPAARAAVDFITDQVAGAGFYTTAKVAEAKVVVDEFNEWDAQMAAPLWNWPSATQGKAPKESQSGQKGK